MLKSLLAAAVLAAAAPAAPALADGPSVHVQIGVHDAHYRGGYRRGPEISRWEAIRIASRVGVERIHDVDYRRGVWEVSGRGRRGARIEVEISARTGRVLDIDYGRGRRGRGYGFGHDGRDRDWRRGW